ncbi:hypothetical protein L2E82_42616 [Cichorium intybus]|uniref:Uncharacterized protein n=1 Tax=Cichorium intybus TaxID=13427 RepID=A0ACB8ZN82_CICIN|nr:hypothetical protein L2E82_42616 [Cichorium intybus]
MLCGDRGLAVIPILFTDNWLLPLLSSLSTVCLISCSGERKQKTKLDNTCQLFCGSRWIKIGQLEDYCMYVGGFVCGSARKVFDNMPAVGKRFQARLVKFQFYNGVPG